MVFPLGNSVVLCASVVKTIEEDPPQRHRGCTENHWDWLFSTGSEKRGQPRS